MNIGSLAIVVFFLFRIFLAGSGVYWIAVGDVAMSTYFFVLLLCTDTQGRK